MYGHRIKAPWVVVALLLIGMALPFSSVAQDAASTPSVEADPDSRAFAFYPAETGFGTFFEVEVERGSSEEFTVLLANTGDVTQELRTYPADVYTAEGGGLAIEEFGAEISGASQWLSIPAETHTVDPETGVEMTFTVTVPESAEPGEYVTSVMAEHAEPLPIEGTDMLTQTFRYAVPIFITVPGEIESSLEIVDVSLLTDNDDLNVSIELANTGDTHLNPEGEIRITGDDGDLIASIPVAVGTLLARDETSLTIAVPGTVGNGTFDVAVELTDPEDDGVSASADLSNLKVEAAATPAPPPPITIGSASVEPGPSVDDVQFASVEATITNTGEPVTNAQLSLLVRRNGEEVERYPISQSLSLPQGDTMVSARYIPLEGWASGEWTFELLLETVEGSGAAVVVASRLIEEPIVIP